MFQRLTVIAIVPLLLIGCRQPAETTVQSRNEHTEHLTVDFDSLYERVEAFNQNDLAYFVANWPSTQAELHKLGTGGHFSKFSLEQQVKLWDRLGYLYECRHPKIYRDHGAEIVEILRLFDLPEENELLDQKQEFLKSLRGSDE